MTNEFKMFDDRKPKTDEDASTNKKIRFGHARKIIDYSEQKKVRPEKIEEIKQVWQSPIFKNNNARLTYLFNHCKSPEHGYTIREFAWARFPDKMADPDPTPGFPSEGEYLGFNAIHKMFNRFRKQELKRDIILAAMYRKLEGEKFGRWYYYNIIDDEQAMKDWKLFRDRCVLGIRRVIQELQDIAEHPEDVQAAHDKHRQELEAMIIEGDREEELKKKQAADRYLDSHKIGRGKGSRDPNQTKLEYQEEVR